MTREELRVELEWFCGCGNPDDAAGFLLRLLNWHPLYEHHDEWMEFLPDSGARYFVLYALDARGLTEHGGSAAGAWLTPKGEAVRDALAREENDGFETLVEPCCVHGYSLEDQGHDCMSAPDPTPKWDRYGQPLEDA